MASGCRSGLFRGSGILDRELEWRFRASGSNDSDQIISDQAHCWKRGSFATKVEVTSAQAAIDVAQSVICQEGMLGSKC